MSSETPEELGPRNCDHSESAAGSIAASASKTFRFRPAMIHLLYHVRRRASAYNGAMRALLIWLLLAAAAPAQTWVYPGRQWSSAEPPEAVGFSARRLAALTPFLESLDTSAVMAVAGGRVIYQYGDLRKISYLASCRKSVLAMLYGNYVASGEIPLDKTLRELELDDVGGLLPREREATIEHLLTARSGVYHPASNPGDATDSAPPRGSQEPGTYQLYNNWDFNAAGTVFEKLTGRNLFDALESELARPIGMQDFDRSQHRKGGDLKRSLHPDYHMHLSTRDMARIGYLMLRGGNWDGRQLIPREWVKRIVSLVTPVYDINPPSWREYGQGSLWGYGYMWWVWDDHRREGPFAGAYTARGALGQYITVLPALDLVVAHKTVPERKGGRRRGVSGMHYQAILMHLVAAHCGKNCGS
jgi:CubicO group peptidase (beta-lactamase class C family)